MISTLILFVGFPILAVRFLCGFERGKLRVSCGNAVKVGWVLVGYTLVWLLLRCLSGEWSFRYGGAFMWWAVFVFPVFLSAGLQLVFRRLWVVALFHLLGIMLVVSMLPKMHL